jgi:DNA-binding IclR family transcriptional regulator
MEALPQQPDPVVGDDELDLATSVGKALTLLSALGSSTMPVGVTALARQTNVAKSTAFRLLAMLEQRGLVERVGSRYRLGVKVFELGNSIPYCRPRSLRDVALPYLVELCNRAAATVHLAVRDGLDVLYIEKLYGHDAVASPSHVGGRVPAHCTALGKSLLAFSGDRHVVERAAGSLEARTPYTITAPALFAQELLKVRAAGFAIDREESRIGLTCVAAPVLDERGLAIASISLSGRTSHLVPERYAEGVRAAAAKISREFRRHRVA